MIQTNWKEMNALEDRWISELTLQEAIDQCLNLYAMAPYFREAEEIFRSERERYLMEWQGRLRRLAQWQEKQSAKSL